MLDAFTAELGRYHYVLPPERIAQAPATPRDSSRLQVHDRRSGQTRTAVFREIGRFLPEGSVLVLNRTKVIPARLHLQRQTGGAVAVLFLGAQKDVMRALASRKLREGEILTLDDGRSFAVERRDGNAWVLRPSFSILELPAVFDRQGTMPLPPYIKETPLTEPELRRAYQSVFAREEGSIAAPTASLHFTERLLDELQQCGIGIAYVTLHVHLGTFAPLTPQQLQEGRLHTESYAIDPKVAARLEHYKKEGRPFVAVGTTVVRTLESAFDERGKITKPAGETNIFIREGYRFKAVDHLVTNFHVPRSSLLMLVSAFAGRETVMGLYERALRKEFRFASFGDAMLIL